MSLHQSPGEFLDHYELVTIREGLQTVRARKERETFHPGIGPMAEARELHVLPQRLVERARVHRPLVVWDVGLGAGANAIAVLEQFPDVGMGEVELHSFDKTLDALRFALEHAESLAYPEPWRKPMEALLEKRETGSGSVRWEYQEGDFRERLEDPEIPAPHAILFDPYSPGVTPELWESDLFRALRQRVGDTPCTLTSYSRSTVIRIALLEAGWFVGKGGATGEKNETTQAASALSLLADPLPIEWLDRVSRSSVTGDRPAVEVARILAEHPQWA